MNLARCHQLTLDQLQKTSYYQNLPQYLTPHLWDHAKLCYQISTRYNPTKFSGNPQVRQKIQSLRQKNFYTTKLLKRVKVHYPHYLDQIKLDSYLTRIPQVCINADKYIQLPDDREVTRQQLKEANANSNALLTYRERRLARKKVISSPVLLFAMGGYPRKHVTFLDKPREIIVLTMPAPQFQLDGLEYQDFIIDSSKKQSSSASQRPLFPQYYPHSNRQLATLREAQQGPKNKYYSIGSSTRYYLDVDALLLSMIEDVTLLLTAFASHIPDHKKGWLNATAMGTGYFAKFLDKTDLSSIIYRLLLRAYQIVLQTTPVTSPIRKIHQIVFPDFSQSLLYRPKFKVHWINLTGQERDALDFRNVDPTQFVCGVINPGNAFAIPGNNFSYSSVESMIGNNTDLRMMQNYHWNPNLLKPSNWVKVRLPDPNHTKQEFEAKENY